MSSFLQKNFQRCRNAEHLLARVSAMQRNAERKTQWKKEQIFSNWPVLKRDAEGKKKSPPVSRAGEATELLTRALPSRVGQKARPNTLSTGRSPTQAHNGCNLIDKNLLRNHADMRSDTASLKWCKAKIFRCIWKGYRNGAPALQPCVVFSFPFQIF